MVGGGGMPIFFNTQTTQLEREVAVEALLNCGRAMSLQITLRPIGGIGYGYRPPEGTPQTQPITPLPTGFPTVPSIPTVPRAPDPAAILAAYGIKVEDGVVTVASKDRTKFLIITPVLVLYVDNSAKSVKLLQQTEVPTYVNQLLSTYGITVG